MQQERFREENRMKIYISGPVTGTIGYVERFAAAEAQLKAAGHEVVNPVKILSRMPAGTTHNQYMKLSLDLMDMCDTVLMLQGWRHSKGASIELDYAVRNAMTITFEGGAGCVNPSRPERENLVQRLVQRLSVETAASVYSAK